MDPPPITNDRPVTRRDALAAVGLATVSSGCSAVLDTVGAGGCAEAPAGLTIEKEALDAVSTSVTLSHDGEEIYAHEHDFGSGRASVSRSDVPIGCSFPASFDLHVDAEQYGELGKTVTFEAPDPPSSARGVDSVIYVTISWEEITAHAEFIYLVA